MSNKDRKAAEKYIRERDIARTETRAGKKIPQSRMEAIRDADRKMGKK